MHRQNASKHAGSINPVMRRSGASFEAQPGVVKSKSNPPKRMIREEEPPRPTSAIRSKNIKNKRMMVREQRDSVSVRRTSGETQVLHTLNALNDHEEYMSIFDTALSYVIKANQYNVSMIMACRGDNSLYDFSQEIRPRRDSRTEFESEMISPFARDVFDYMSQLGVDDDWMLYTTPRGCIMPDLYVKLRKNPHNMVFYKSSIIDDVNDPDYVKLAGNWLDDGFDGFAIRKYQYLKIKSSISDVLLDQDKWGQILYAICSQYGKVDVNTTDIVISSQMLDHQDDDASRHNDNIYESLAQPDEPIRSTIEVTGNKIAVGMTIQKHDDAMSAIRTIEWLLWRQDITPDIYVLEVTSEPHSAISALSSYNQVHYYPIVLDRYQQDIDQTCAMRNIILNKVKDNRPVVFIDPGVICDRVTWLSEIYDRIMDSQQLVIQGFKYYQCGSNNVCGSSLSASVHGERINPYGVHAGLCVAMWRDAMLSIRGFNPYFVLGGANYLTALEMFGAHARWNEDSHMRSYFSSMSFYDDALRQLPQKFEIGHTDALISVVGGGHQFPEFMHRRHLSMLRSSTKLINCINISRNGLAGWKTLNYRNLINEEAI